MSTLVILVVIGLILYALISASSRSSARRSRTGSRPSPGRMLSIELSDESEFRADRPRPKQVTPAAGAAASDRSWVPVGTDAKVAGHTIPDGMIYVGRGVPPIGGWQECEPALIDPTLPVARRNPDFAGERMSYWPSYSQIPPECRAAYLGWLADGRSDPSAYIGYVFLFFYGLERRLLFDLRHLPERRGEAMNLIAELERLLSVYSGNRSFQGYGSSLLQTARALWESGRAYQREPSFSRGNSTLPTDVRLALGQLVAAGKPIPAKWALAWVVGDPETRLRTPARRCPDEFRELFLRRFGERFGTGMALKPNKRRLKISHAPASASFGGPVEVPFDDLPEVGALSRPLRTLREIAETAVSELEGYSRFVGRKPEHAGSLEALALLPHELAEGHQSPEAERLRAWIDSGLTGRDHAVASGAEVMAHWRCARDDRMGKGELGSFARMLESLGYGLEPDPRFGGGTIGADQKAVLFRLGAERPTAASPTYRAATLLLHLAAAVATSDGDVSEEEERHLAEHLERSMNLGEAEIRRLRAHLQWLLASQPSLSGVKQRLEEIDERGRQHLAQFAVAIAGADGMIDPEEVKTLAKIYQLLGLDREQAYGDIHSLQTDTRWRPADHPVTVRPPDGVDADYAIPSRPERETPAPEGGFRLNMERVERTLAETVAVSNMLAEIFVEQDEPVIAPAVLAEALETSAGLDPAHTALLRALEGHPELSREEFEELAEGLGLLSDGALETLNEAAFEQVDRPLLEGEDPVAVDLQTLGEMMR